MSIVMQITSLVIFWRNYVERDKSIRSTQFLILLTIKGKLSFQPLNSLYLATPIYCIRKKIYL